MMQVKIRIQSSICGCRSQCLFLVVTILRFQFPHILVRILQIVVAYFLQDFLQVHLEKKNVKICPAGYGE